MPKLLASVAFVATLLLPLGPQAAQAQPATTARTCPGVALGSFEQRFPADVTRFAFEQAMLEPFLELWKSGRRPDLPVVPEKITVYALPGKPYLIGYLRGDCLIAFLSVERQRLWQWLRPRIGWAV